MLLENTTAWFICAYSIGFEQNNYLHEELQNLTLSVINGRCTNKKTEYFHC